MNNSSPSYDSVAYSPAEIRQAFIRNTYSHLAMAVVAFAFLEYFLISYTSLGQVMMQFLGKSQMMWLVVLGGFMGVSYIAQGMANSSSSQGMQYAGLGLYVVGEAIIFLPILLMASQFAPGVIVQAAVATGGLFLALTMIAFTTKKDFSFLGGMLKMAFFVALALIAGSIFFGFNLGTWFSGAMILIAGGSILYSTSNIIHHYHPSQHVAASLSLFASIATLFWYILRILMSSRD